mmetsp:Transcript_6568/g.15658  ORF Transcript_6568/g.15658 Transcript_6568/m.15658 type:complete len:158 (-) Transcript_6568:1661-2134(-)
MDGWMDSMSPSTNLSPPPPSPPSAASFCLSSCTREIFLVHAEALVSRLKIDIPWVTDERSKTRNRCPPRRGCFTYGFPKTHTRRPPTPMTIKQYLVVVDFVVVLCCFYLFHVDPGNNNKNHKTRIYRCLPFLPKTKQTNYNCSISLQTPTSSSSILP